MLFKFFQCARSFSCFLCREGKVSSSTPSLRLLFNILYANILLSLFQLLLSSFFACLEFWLLSISIAVMNAIHISYPSSPASLQFPSPSFIVADTWGVENAKSWFLERFAEKSQEKVVIIKWNLLTEQS